MNTCDKWFLFFTIILMLLWFGIGFLYVNATIDLCQLHDSIVQSLKGNL